MIQHAKSMASQAREEMTVRICPVTAGRPTRMLERSFWKMCKRHLDASQRDAGKSEWGIGRSVGSKYCLECCGKKPKEVEFIDTGEIDMPIKTKKGKCELCGAEKQIKKNNGLEVCSTCAAMQAVIKRAPDMVLAEMRRLGMLDRTKDNSNIAADFERLREEKNRLQDIIDDLKQVLAEPDESCLVAAAKEIADEVVILMDGLAKSSQFTTLEEKTGPATSIPIDRLVSDKELIDTLARLQELLSFPKEL